MGDKSDPLGELDAEALRERIADMAMLALDLAQQLEFSLRFLKGRKREQALREACEMAYRLHLFPYEGSPLPKGEARRVMVDDRGVRIERYELDRPPAHAAEHPSRAADREPARGKAREVNASRESSDTN